MNIIHFNISFKPIIIIIINKKLIFLNNVYSVFVMCTSKGDTLFQGRGPEIFGNLQRGRIVEEYRNHCVNVTNVLTSRFIHIYRSEVKL